MTAGNDPRLERLLGAGEEDAAAEIEALVVGQAQPLIRRLLAHQARSSSAIGPDDVEELGARITLKLVEKLRRVRSSPDAAIRNFESYVVTLTQNAVHDHLRERFPERARLKKRLRRALTDEPRTALWTTRHGVASGLEEWEGREDVLHAVPEDPARNVDPERLAAALVALFAALRQPVLFEALVSFVAVEWKVADLPDADVDQEAVAAPAAEQRTENRDFARALWREIVLLNAMQRKALLLNLRYSGTTNVVALIVLTGVARLAEVAEALEMTPHELAALWKSLPLEDQRIAEMLGVTRQQVINLRRAARERLERRLRR